MFSAYYYCYLIFCHLCLGLYSINVMFHTMYHKVCIKKNHPLSKSYISLKYIQDIQTCGKF